MNIPTAGDKVLGLDVIARTLQSAAAQLKKLATKTGDTHSRKSVPGGKSHGTYGKEFMLAQAAKYIETFRECPKKASGGNWHPVTAHCAEAIGGLPCPRTYLKHWPSLKDAWKEAIAVSGCQSPLNPPYGADRPTREAMIEWVRQYHERFGTLPETSHGKQTWTEQTLDSMLSMGQVVKYHWVREVFGRRSALCNAAGFKVKQRNDSRAKPSKIFKAPAGSLAETAARELSKPWAPPPIPVFPEEPDGQLRMSFEAPLPDQPKRRRQPRRVEPEAIAAAALKYYSAYGSFPTRGTGNHWHPRCEAKIKAIGGFPSPGVIVRRYGKLANAWTAAVELQKSLVA